MNFIGSPFTIGLPSPLSPGFTGEGITPEKLAKLKPQMVISEEAARQFCKLVIGTRLLNAHSPTDANGFVDDADWFGVTTQAGIERGKVIVRGEYNPSLLRPCAVHGMSYEATDVSIEDLTSEVWVVRSIGRVRGIFVGPQHEMAFGEQTFFHGSARLA